MKRIPILLAILSLFPPIAQSHPHFSKEVRFSFERGEDASGGIVVSHITVPYNEIAAGDLEKGKTWHLGFAKLKTGAPIQIGGASLEPGEYAIQVKREDEKKWSLLLVQKAGENDEKQISIESDLKTDLSSEEHLRLDIQPGGSKDDTVVELVVRFGPYRLATPVKKSD